jgi:hypothetical protein
MSNVIIKCDRCKQDIEGLQTEDFTGGFYRTEGYWSKFANEGEKIVCDNCMFNDARYILVYGRRT